MTKNRHLYPFILYHDFILVSMISSLPNILVVMYASKSVLWSLECISLMEVGISKGFTSQYHGNRDTFWLKKMSGMHKFLLFTLTIKGCTKNVHLHIDSLMMSWLLILSSYFWVIEPCYYCCKGWTVNSCFFPVVF